MTRKLLELASIPTKDITGVEATPSTNSKDTTESHAGIKVSSTCFATSHLTRHLTTGSNTSSATSRSTTRSTTSSTTNSTITGGTVELSGIVRLRKEQRMTVLENCLQLQYLLASLYSGCV